MTRRFNSIHLGCILLAVTAFAPACTEVDNPENEELGSLEAGRSEFTDNAVVVDWNQIAVDAAFRVADPPGFIDLTNVRGWTMMHLAIHDALNAIRPDFDQYAFFGSQTSAHPTAAAAQAGHDVLVHIYPTEQATLDAELAGWLATVPAGTGKQQGIQLGQAAAAAIIAARQNDNMLVFGEYTPQDPPQPGDYQFVPPLAFVFRPAFGNATPFALQSGTQFRPGPPPALTSNTWRNSYNEVKAFGVLNSTARSQDQTNYAAWWREFSEVGWNRASRIIATQRSLDLYPAARMFALVNMAVVDATVAIWNAKQFYDFWRPFTAIRNGGTDGNPGTAPDPNWLPQHDTPPIQEYPSAHAIQSAAAARVLRLVYGTNNIAFSMTSTTGLPGAEVRSFNTLSQAALEAADSRVMAGFHFRFAVNVGLEMGGLVANHVVSNELRRQDDDDDDDDD